MENGNSGVFGMVAQIIDISALDFAAFLDQSRLVSNESDDVHENFPQSGFVVSMRENRPTRSFLSIGGSAYGYTSSEDWLIIIFMDLSSMGN